MRQIARRSDIRDLILDAVDDLLAKYGYGKMTVDDVARQVGIGKGTIYLHFPSKEELVLAHIDRIAETVVRKLEEMAGSSDSVDRRLRGMLVLRVLHRFDSVAHYSQSLGDLLSSVRAALLVRRQAYFEKEAAVFEGVLREANRLGTPRLPRSPDGLVRPHPKHEFPSPVQPVGPRARPQGRAGGPGRPHRRPFDQRASAEPVAAGQLDAMNPASIIMTHEEV